MSKTALVTGGSGLLGRQVMKAFERAGWQVTGTALTRANPPALIRIDLCNESAIEQALEEIKSSFTVGKCFIACQSSFIDARANISNLWLMAGAAQRFPDVVDKDPSAARSLNVEASSALARATMNRSILLIYISTDYVFPGTEGDAPYEADADTRPPNLYGQLKLDGENAVLEATRKSGMGLVLRVPVLYGPTESNEESAVNTLVDSVWKAQKEKVIMDDWSIRYPTNTEDVGRVCADIAARYLAACAANDLASLPHIVQFSSEDRYTKYGICELLAEILGISMGKMEANKLGNDPNASVQRPYDCHLSTTALKKTGISVDTQDFRAWWRWRLRAHR